MPIRGFGAVLIYLLMAGEVYTTRREFRKNDTERGLVILPLESDEGRELLMTY